MNECVNMLLYRMYVIWLNAPRRCTWGEEKKEKKRERRSWHTWQHGCPWRRHPELLLDHLGHEGGNAWEGNPLRHHAERDEQEAGVAQQWQACLHKVLHRLARVRGCWCEVHGSLRLFADSLDMGLRHTDLLDLAGGCKARIWQSGHVPFSSFAGLAQTCPDSHRVLLAYIHV